MVLSLERLCALAHQLEEAVTRHRLDRELGQPPYQPDLEALRQHLIDMNEVTLRAEAVAKPIDGGLDIAVTGSGRTLTAIQHKSPRGRRR